LIFLVICFVLEDRLAAYVIHELETCAVPLSGTLFLMR